jgi:RND family efflux transporter MFP subunit
MKIYRAIKIAAASVAVLVAIIFLLKLSKGVEVKTYAIQRQPLLITVTATSIGTIKAETEARISAQRTGRVTRLLFDEGSFVNTQKVIAEIDYEEAYFNLKLAEAALQKTKARYNEMNALLDVLKVDTSANIAKAEAVLFEVERRLKRARELIKMGYITEVELDATEKEYAVAKAALDSALSGKKQIEAKLHDIKALEAAVKEAENNFAIAKLNYDYSFIRSPINGVVTARFVELGDTVTKGNIIGTVVSLDSLYVEAFIDEADISKVSIGKEVNVTMDAYQNKTFIGEVYRVSPVVTGGRQETRTFEVRIRLKEMPPSIKPGMSADVEVIVDKAENALVILSQSVIERNGKHFVFVVRDSKARFIPIKSGLSNWTYTEVLDGVKEGDEVILNPDAAGLGDGVKIKKSGG